MCRFTFYNGPALRLASLVTEPENSLIHQSFESLEREEPLNGDGFGIAWYPTDETVPGLFRAVTPAWNNANLLSLASAVKSSCILAHVRAATQVRNVGEVNCHPFVSGRLAFMHNGDLGGFLKLRRALLADLSDEAFHGLQGQTDSEHLFALLRDRAGESGDLTVDALGDAVREAFAHAVELSRRFAPGEHSYLNVAVTDGRCAVVTRFTTEDGYAGESLYWNSGKRYVCDGGVCHMVAPETTGSAVLVSSERLSDDPGWEAVPRNHMLLVSADRTARLVPLEL
jgi:predicted glutamine amidotransferase